MHSPGNSFNKDYTGIFYIVYDGNFPCIEGKVSVERNSSMGEMHGLSLIVIDLYVKRSHYESIAVRRRCSFLRT